MRGKIVEVNCDSCNTYGLIEGNNGEIYHFSKESLLKEASMEDFSVEDEVSFSIRKTELQYDHATYVRLEKHTDKSLITGYATPGLSKRLNLKVAEQEHLKGNSGELELIRSLSNILMITYIGHYSMDQSSIYPFCLASASTYFKQFVRETGEFLIIFSHFDSENWQQKTLKVETELRKRRDILDRKPLINFYILISNAKELRTKIESIKGEPRAAIIPFSFVELLSCENERALLRLMLQRFGEYYFENNMFAENDAIDNDKLLFGDRGKIADSVVSRCIKGSNSGIFGLRRSGKTSVLNAVLRRLERESVSYVLLESRTYETSSSWKSALYDISIKIRAELMNVKQEAGEDRESFLARLILSSKKEDYMERPVASFVEDVKHYTDGRKVIIAIDEIELITYNTATSDAWKKLEAYKGFWSAMRDCGCPIIICGVNSTINEVSNLHYDGEQCDNPMYGRIINCAESTRTYLPAFTSRQTREMINSLGQYSNIGFTEVYEQVNRAFGGQPWVVRQFCSFVFEKVKDKRAPDRIFEVNKAILDNLLHEFQSSSQGINLCRTILQHLSIYHSEYQLLKRIALNPEKYRKISSEDIIEIDHLQKYGLIEYDSTTNYITFNIDIIRDYIRESEKKSPADMNNDERRQYIQDKIRVCEKNLKKYILNYYSILGDKETGKSIFFHENKCILKKHKGIVPSNCQFDDFFDHKKFDFYFSKLKEVLSDNWDTLGKGFENINISKERFNVYMDDLNAARTDADHYDPDNLSRVPSNFEISDDILQSFQSAYKAMLKFFKEVHLLYEED